DGAPLATQRERTRSTDLPANFLGGTLGAVTLVNDVCAPGTVYSVYGSNLPGLSSPQAGIPAGLTGTPTIAQFAATAGRLNVCNGNRYIDITPRSQREGALLSAHYELAGSADVFT